MQLKIVLEADTILDERIFETGSLLLQSLVLIVDPALEHIIDCGNIDLNVYKLRLLPSILCFEQLLSFTLLVPVFLLGPLAFALGYLVHYLIVRVRLFDALLQVVFFSQLARLSFHK